MFRTIPIEKGWRFRESSTQDAIWMPVDKVPSVVHVDLIKQGVQVVSPRERYND